MKSETSGLSLRHNFAWNLFGTIILSATQWGLIVILAKLVEPDELGRYSLAIAICAPIVLSTGMNLRFSQTTDLTGKYVFSNYISVRFLTAIPALGIILAIALSNNRALPSVLLILIVGMNKVIENFSEVAYGLFQKHEHLDLLSKSKVLRGVGGIIAFLILMLTTKNLVISLLGWGCWAFVILVMFDFKKASRWEKVTLKFPREILWSLTRKTFPLGIVVGTMSVNGNMARYFLAYFLDDAAVGYYSAIVFLLAAFLLPMNCLGIAAMARLSKYYRSNIKYYRRLFIKLVVLVLLMSFAALAVTYFLGKQILALFYRPDYAEYWPCLMIGMASLIFAGILTIANSAFTATRKFHQQPYIYIFVFLCLIISNYFLVPRFGIIGAMFATFVSGFLQTFLTVTMVLWSSRKAVSEDLSGD